MLVSDEDYEWCASIVIEADSSLDAKKWGDKISNKYSSKNTTEKFLHSTIQLYAKEDFTNIDIPTIPYGYWPLDDEVGW